jgi:flagellar protein FlgJ
MDTAYVPFSERKERLANSQMNFSDLLKKTQQSEKLAPYSLHLTPSLTPQTVEDKKLYEQCEALETFLIKNLLSGMRKTVMKSDLIDTGFAGEVYEDMLWDEYAKEYSKGAGFGLAQMAYAELKGQRGTLIERFM